MLFYSFIIPVYNRPEEIRELLDSFLNLEAEGLQYEIIIIEDGSTITSEKVAEDFKDKLPVIYYKKENSGPGPSRNFGMKRANGNYFIILDSDVILPADYLQNVHNFLARDYADCYGGADKAHPSFSPIQKAINFSMTSFLTTGGIRGRKKSLEKFKPRSFNMGISKKAFQATEGFSNMRVGEDLDLSIRLEKADFSIVFIPKAFVFHKRRSSWKSFFKQVYNFGKGRPVLNKWYPHTFSFVFWFPSLFLIGFIFSVCLLLGFQLHIFMSLYFIYFLLIFVSSSFENKSLKIGFLSIYASFLQFFGYGLGYLKSIFFIKLQQKEPRDVFPELFKK